MAHVETARTRRRTIDEAGFSTTSGISVLAGSLVAFGAIALVAAAAGALGSTLGLDTDGISTDEWRQAGIAGAVAASLVLFASFFFGGYTAGRMSRRAGARHGVLVFVLSVLVMGGIGLAAWAASDTPTTGDVEESIDDAGVPTDADTWNDIGLGAAIASGVAMLLGSIAGGIRGDRWHTRLADAVRTNRDARVDDRDLRADGKVDTDPFDRTRSVDLREDADHTQLSIEEERARAGK